MSLRPQAASDGQAQALSVLFSGLAHLTFSLLHTPFLSFSQSGAGWQEVAAVTSKVGHLPPEHLTQTSLVSSVSCPHPPSNP